MESLKTLQEKALFDQHEQQLDIAVNSLAERYYTMSVVAMTESIRSLLNIIAYQRGEIIYREEDLLAYIESLEDTPFIENTILDSINLLFKSKKAASRLMSGTSDDLSRDVITRLEASAHIRTMVPIAYLLRSAIKGYADRGYSGYRFTSNLDALPTRKLGQVETIPPVLKDEIRVLVKLVEEYTAVDKIIFYGSRARGTADLESDSDTNLMLLLDQFPTAVKRGLEAIQSNTAFFYTTPLELKAFRSVDWGTEDEHVLLKANIEKDGIILKL